MSDKNTISEKPDDWAKIELNSYEGDEPYVFVSYSHADTAAVYEVLKLLDREKFRISARSCVGASRIAARSCCSCRSRPCAPSIAAWR